MSLIKDEIKNLISSKLQEDLSSIQKLRGGRNSNIFKLCTKTNEYIAKQYIVRKGDTRDRLTTEYEGLSYLWKNNIRNIPEPLCLSRENQLGIYRFIKGNKITSKSITKKDIKTAVKFLKSIHLLTSAKYADRQPIASEACFSIQAYIDDIKNRVKKLKTITGKEKEIGFLHNYINNEYIPFLNTLLKTVYSECEDNKIDIHEQLPNNKRTLSPTDFSFHNAIRGKDRIYFFDFEYYGWDDPAKVIANFYLHPAVPIPLSMRKLFYRSVYSFWGKDKELKKRLPVIYLLLSMKWCLIMLNVFKWTNTNERVTKALYNQQLKRAIRQLRKTKIELKKKQFPLSLSK